MTLICLCAAKFNVLVSLIWFLYKTSVGIILFWKDLTKTFLLGIYSLLILQVDSVFILGSNVLLHYMF